VRVAKAKELRVRKGKQAAVTHVVLARHSVHAPVWTLLQACACVRVCVCARVCVRVCVCQTGRSHTCCLGEAQCSRAGVDTPASVCVCICVCVCVSNRPQSHMLSWQSTVFTRRCGHSCKRVRVCLCVCVCQTGRSHTY